MAWDDGVSAMEEEMQMAGVREDNSPGNVLTITLRDPADEEDQADGAADPAESRSSSRGLCLIARREKSLSLSLFPSSLLVSCSLLPLLSFLS
jgi:hypothetical protein